MSTAITGTARSFLFCIIRTVTCYKKTVLLDLSARAELYEEFTLRVRLFWPTYIPINEVGLRGLMRSPRVPTFKLLNGLIDIYETW
jgi:hypothetical protein